MTNAPTAKQVAIVTGGASGIGKGLCRDLVRRGMEVVVADRQGEVAEQVARELRAAGGRAQACELDVRSYPAFKQVVDDTVARCGRIDYLFNNAGIGIGGPIESYVLSDWDDMFDVNLRGVAYGIHAVYPVMREQGFGHIVNTASAAGLVPGAGQGSYTASKHAVVGLSKVLRIEAAPYNVRVSVLCPGVIRTPCLSGGQYGRLTISVSEAWVSQYWERLKPMDPDLFARKAIDDVMKNKAIIVIPRAWKLLWYIERLSPLLSMWLGARAFQEVRAQLLQAGVEAATSTPLNGASANVASDRV